MPFHETEYSSAEWAQMLEPLDEKYHKTLHFNRIK